MAQSYGKYRTHSLIASTDIYAIYRASAGDGDDHQYFLKVEGLDFPSQKGSRVVHEFDVLRNLQLPCALEPVELIEVDSNRIAVFKHIKGRWLSEIIAQAADLSLTTKLSLAIKLLESLQEVHRRDVTVGGLQPGNILLHGNDLQVVFTDYSKAKTAKYFSRHGAAATWSEQQLPYLAPEQSGRLAQQVDQRADLYTVGMILYEVFTGHKAFVCDGAAEYIHHHLTVPLPSLRDTDPSWPEPISDILAHLAEKDPQARYSSAWGARCDLQDCLQQLNDNGHITQVTIGQRDVLDELTFPNNLIGRDEEIRILTDAYRIFQQGETTSILICGNSGIGKSRLVDELKLQVLEDQTLWIKGAFQGHQDSRPFDAILHTFAGLIKRLLSRSEEDLAYWRERFRETLGGNAGIITRLIPELELIIGKQSQPVELGPKEEQSRFNLTFRNFLRAFCSSEHKLVLVLDDIQWIDGSSLAMLNQLISRDKVENFMLIGCYKADGQAQQIRLEDIERNIQTEWCKGTILRLTGLGLPAINELLSQTFRQNAIDLGSLAEVVHAKTRGNPFFVQEFLRLANKKELIWFDEYGSQWQWDIGRLQTESITDNTVSLVIDDIRSLGEQAIQVICTASCIGKRFKLDELVSVMDLSARVVKRELMQLCDMGLLVPNNEVSLNLLQVTDVFLSNAQFIFSHTRVFEAAYSVLEPAERDAIRFRVGITRLRQETRNQVEENIFEVVGYLARGEPPEDLRIYIAELYLQAGIKARRSSGFQVSMRYLTRCALLLRESDPWAEHYNLTLKLFQEIALVAFLNKQRDVMNHAISEVLKRSRSTLDKIFVLEVKIQDTMTRDLLAAIDIAIPVMAYLGARFPRRPSRLRVVVELLWTMASLAGRDYIDELEKMPKVDDPLFEACMRIGCKVGSAAYLALPNLTPLLVSWAVRNGLNKGHVSYSAFAYSAFGTILTGVFGKLADAHRLGAMSVRLATNFRENDQLCRVKHMMSSFIRHWNESVHVCLPELVQAYRIGVEAGEFEFACHAINLYAFYAFYAGTNLDVLDDELQRYREVVGDLNQYHLTPHTEMYRQGALNLQEGSYHKIELVGEAFNENHFQDVIERTEDLAFYHAVLKLMLCYYFGHDTDALVFAKDCRRKQHTALGSLAIPVFLFFEAMTRLRLLQQRRLKMRKLHEHRILVIIKNYKKWARHIEANFGHRLALLQAEWKRYRGDIREALIYYRRSYDLARQFDFIHDEALAAERFADYLNEQGLMDMAAFYHQAALKAYENWGATKKLHFLAKNTHKYEGKAGLLVSQEAPDLDFEAMKIALAEIAQEVSHESLKDKILASALNFAGADRGHLILKDIETDELKLVKSSTDETDVFVGRAFADCPKVCQSILHFVKRTAQPLVIDDAQVPNRKLPGLESDPYVQESVVRSLAVIPLKTQDENRTDVMGMIYLENRQASHVFSRERFQILEMIGQTAAARIELSEKAHSLERSLQETELVQQALLPSGLESSHFRVSDYYRSADHAGGDWFGFYENRQGGRLYFFLGDVTGHGVSSSLVTGTAAGAAYSSLAALEHHPTDLGLAESIQIVAASVNRAVFDTAAKIDKMMTMVFAVIEADTGRGVYISAGHPAGCIIGPQGNRILTPTGSPLGYRAEPGYQAREMQLEPGASLFFYTDGLFENRGPDGRELKLRKVMKSLRFDWSPAKNRDQIVQMGRAVWQERKPEDDCAFVIIQWSPAQDRHSVDWDEAS